MRLPFPLALLLLTSGAVFGSTTTSITRSHGHDVWDTDHGFPGGYIYGITQTSDGYIWIGTSKGLLRYDGLTFALVGTGASAGVSPLLGVLVDSNNQLWGVDDHTHLFRYVAGRLEPFPDNIRHQYLPTPVSRTSDGWLLLASQLQGLVEYKNGAPQVVLDPDRVPNQPTAVTQTADGSFWIGTVEAGVFRVSIAQDGSATIQQVTGLKNVKINCLLPLGPSTLLVGTDKGLLTIHNGSLIPRAARELRNRVVLTLATGLAEDIWVGTDGDVFKINSNSIKPDEATQPLEVLEIRRKVTALFEDRDGNLWIGGPEAIERYRDNGFSSYLSSAGLPCGNCGAIYVDHRDRLWFAPWDGGLFRIARSRIEPIEVAGLNSDTVYSIAGGATNEIWVARKYGGLTRLLLNGDALQASTYTQQVGLASDAVYSIYRAPDGTVWAGTLGAGLSRLRGNAWRTFTMQDGLPSNVISAIVGGPTGEIFAGTPNGLAAFKDDHWTAYTARDGLPPGPIESLFLDGDNVLWIGTTKGLSFLQAGAVHVPLGAPTPLYGEIVGIAERSGWLWITSHDHVLRVRRAALLQQSFKQGDYREFGLAEGLPGVEGVKRSRSVVQDDHGRLWFSLNKGISVLQPSAFAGPTFSVSTRLDGVVVDGRLVTPANSLRFPAGRHRFTFRYAGVNVSDPGGVRFRYKLDNVDTAWSEPTALREIDYTNIPPGRFQFHVVASNPDGIWSENESTMAFQVEPAYWQTLWFQAFGVTTLVLLGVGLYQLRLRQVHRQMHAGLEARVSERVRIARELHDTLLQSLHGVTFQFQAARNLLPDRPHYAMETLDGALSATEHAITESRGAIHDLRAGPACSGDLAESLRSAAEELADSHHAESPVPAFQLIIDGERKALSPVLQDEVYRIARELLLNAFRHAGGDRIEVEIHYGERVLRLRIRDNGKGIDQKVLKAGGSPGHWGLRGVRERAQRIGAQLDFWSEPGAGTEVQLNVPGAAAYQASGHSSYRN